jgi:hypothetical protein
VAGDPALAFQLGAKLARRTEFHVIGKELIVNGVGTPLDNEAIRFQHKAGNYAFITAAAEQEDDTGEGHGENAFRCSSKPVAEPPRRSGRATAK